MSKYKVGDELRIREWDDMAKEFELNGSDYINCRYGFTNGMKSLCGMSFTVSKIIGDHYYSEEGSGYGWNISSDMLEPIKEENLYIASEKEFNKLLGIF